MNFRDLLLKKFPSIYKPNCDISTQEGWNNIILQLSEKIMDSQKNIQVSQVKEKFGELRFYYRPHDADIDLLISDAERQASTTCEKCGKQGRLLNNCGWMSVLCQSCWTKE